MCPPKLPMAPLVPVLWRRRCNTGVYDGRTDRHSDYVIPTSRCSIAERDKTSLLLEGLRVKNKSKSMFHRSPVCSANHSCSKAACSRLWIMHGLCKSYVTPVSTPRQESVSLRDQWRQSARLDRSLCRSETNDASQHA